jgi:hypothetical protein
MGLIDPKETIATGSFKEGDLSLIAIALGVCVQAASSVGWHHRLVIGRCNKNCYRRVLTLARARGSVFRQKLSRRFQWCPLTVCVSCKHKQLLVVQTSLRLVAGKRGRPTGACQ